MGPKSFAFDEGNNMGTGRSILRAFFRCFILLGGFIVASSTIAVADKDYPASIINHPIRLSR